MTPHPPYDTTSVEVPGGRIVVVVDPVDGAVVASGFTDLDAVFGFLTEGEQARGHREVEPHKDSVSHVVDALTAYSHGTLNALDHVVVRQPGGPFMQRAWLELRAVRAGEVDTYAGLAERAGSPRAVRGAGVCQEQGGAVRALSPDPAYGRRSWRLCLRHPRQGGAPRARGRVAGLSRARLADQSRSPRLCAREPPRRSAQRHRDPTECRHARRYRSVRGR